MLFSLWQAIVWKRMVCAAVRSSGRSLRVESLEDRVTPAGIFAVGAAPGSPALVSVFDAVTRQQKFTINAFDASFTGGVNVAVGDVNGDGTADVIAGAGSGGGPTVNVFSGVDGSLLKSFTLGDDSARAGASVAAADYDQDGLADVVIGTTRNGQPLVQVVRFSDGTVLHGYAPFEGSNGVSVAAGDVNGDGVPDTVVGAGPNGGPRVTVFDGRTDAVVLNLFAFEPTFTGGVQVSAGDLNGDRRTDVIAAAGFLGGPRVQAFSGPTGVAIQNFFAYGEGLRAGVSASAFDSDGNGTLDIVTTNGPGQPADPKAFDGRTLAQLATPSFFGLAASAAYDTTTPTPTVSSAAAEPTRTSPIPFQVLFSEAVNGFSVAGLTLANGTVSNFVRLDARTYTFDVTPSADGAVVVAVASEAATDAAGNGSASASLSRTFDTTAPAVTANPLTTNSTTPTLTGTVSETGSTVTVTVGGQTITATVSGTNWSAVVPTPLAEGTYTVTAAATDPAGNAGTGTGSLVIDTTAPSTTVSSTAPDPTSASPIPFTVTFGEDVTGFAVTDPVVTNGTASGLVVVDARTYTFNVTPTGAGSVAVFVPAQVATDAAGNGSAASNTVSRTFQTRTIGLTANPLTTNATTPTLTGTVDDSTATVTVSVGGQTVTASVSGTSWSATLPTPLAEGAYDIRVSATNTAGNTGSRTLTGGLVVDTTAPTALVSTMAASPTNAATIPFAVAFSEDVTGFGTGGLAVQNGTVSNFTRVDPRTYTFDVTPASDGLVSVSINAGAATDAAGNGNAASSTVSVTSDRTAPTPLVSSSAPATTTDNPIPFAVTFDEDATGFAAADVMVANGSVLGFTQVDARTYTFGVVPAGPGDVTVSVAAGVATDAAGNGSTASNTVSVTSDRTAPSVAISTTEPDPTAAAVIPFTVTFSEAVTGFGQTGLSVTNGSVSNFMVVDARTYTFDVAPAGDGQVTVTVPAGVAQDLAGNGNTAGSFSITSERFAPTATVSSTAGPATNVSPIPFTVVFSEDVTGFDQTGLDVTNGTASDFTPVDARTYTVTVTPDAEGDVTVSVKAGAAQDGAGNQNLASAPFTVTFDTTAPTATVTAADPTNADPIVFTVAFDEEVTDLSATGLEATNGIVGTVTRVDARTFTVEVSPAADGPVTLTVLAGATTDRAGNPTAADFAAAVTSDRTAPTAALKTAATSPTNLALIPFTVTFSEDVTALTVARVSVTNGSVSNLVMVDARTYTFDVAPDADGDVIVSVQAGATSDAAGNGSTASNALTVTSDRTAPAAITTTESDPTSADVIPFTVSFSEDVTGFDETGLAVQNGSVSNFTVVDARTYTFDVAPAGDGLVTVTVAAGAATDAAGNTNPIATFSITSERFAPTITGATVDPASTPNGAYGAGTVIDILLTFGESVAVDTTGGTPTLVLNSGGTAVYVGGSGTDTLTFRYTVLAGENSPDLNYTAADALAPNGATITDAAGNAAVPTLPAPGDPGSLGASRDIAIDTTAPTVAVGTESTGGLSGTADDTGGSGVAQVEVSIRDVNGTGLYWDEMTQGFTSMTELFFKMTDTSVGGDLSSWSYALSPTVTGDFEVNARATDVAGNQGFDLETVTIT